MPQPRVLAAAGLGLLTGGLLVTTAALPAVDEASRELTTLSDGALPAAVVIAVFALAAPAPLGVLAWARDTWAAAGLALATCAVLLPLWAGWADLDARWRALALAAGPLAVAGLALMARSWVGVALASSAAVLHALAYDPFRDVGCGRDCVEASAPIALSVGTLTLVVALLLTVCAAFVVVSAVRKGAQLRAVAAGACVLAVLGLVRWQTVGDADVYADLQLFAVPVPGLVALPSLVSWVRTAHRRVAVRRLARHLAEDPEGLLDLGERVDVSLLSAGQRLALHNARLAAASRARLVEVRASQRRVVAAADAERRRIERDLHDGTQQRLVGVLMQLSGRGLDEVERQIRDVLADLRSFSHGLFPPVLEEEGLAVALTELAATSDADLRLDLKLDRPVPAEQGRAVYALVARHTSGTAEVSVTCTASGLDVTVVGCHDGDLTDVRDRFGALGGDLSVSPGEIEGSLPCAW